MQSTERLSTGRGHRRRGFTLIEVLIVIGVIALLIGIIAVAINVVSNNMSKNATRVAFANADGLRTEYETSTPLAGLILTRSVEATSDNTAYRLTAPAMVAFRKMPKNAASLSSFGAKSAGRLDVSDWVAGIYAAGEVVEYPALSGTLYVVISAIPTNTTPGPSDWATLSEPITGLLDGWGKPIAYVGAGGLTLVDRGYKGGDAASDGSYDAANSTIRAPSGRPFWVSAGPDGDFRTGDDNVYSFEN